MLVLQFELGDARYAIDTSVVLEVLPLARLRPWPSAPAGVAGLVEFGGTPAPVIDLAMLMLSRPAEPRLSTRLVVINFQGPRRPTQILGLIAERATTTVRCDANDFAWLSIDGERADCLGPVATDERGLLQLIDLPRLAQAFTRTLPAAIQGAPWPLPTSNNS